MLTRSDFRLNLLLLKGQRCVPRFLMKVVAPNSNFLIPKSKKLGYYIQDLALYPPFTLPPPPHSSIINAPNISILYWCSFYTVSSIYTFLPPFHTFSLSCFSRILIFVLYFNSYCEKYFKNCGLFEVPYQRYALAEVVHLTLVYILFDVQ